MRCWGFIGSRLRGFMNRVIRRILSLFQIVNNPFCGDKFDANKANDPHPNHVWVCNPVPDDGGYETSEEKQAKRQQSLPANQVSNHTKFLQDTPCVHFFFFVMGVGVGFVFLPGRTAQWLAALLRVLLRGLPSTGSGSELVEDRALERTGGR